MRTILVGTDLTERSNPAILRGAELARANGARLVVCHVGPRHIGVHTLFPQEYHEDLAVSGDWEKRVADAITERVVQLTGLDKFDVVLDEGDPSSALCQHASRLSADLIIVMSDRRDGESGTVTRELASSPCSVLVLGERSGSAVALVTLESEVDRIPELAAKARSVFVRPLHKFVVIMWADLPQNRRAPLMARLNEQQKELGITLEPWFADPGETALLARVARDPDIGLVALISPTPDKVVANTASPLDDALDVGTSSLLLIRG